LIKHLDVAAIPHVMLGNCAIQFERMAAPMMDSQYLSDAGGLAPKHLKDIPVTNASQLGR
jgi:hypothetical protein